LPRQPCGAEGHSRWRGTVGRILVHSEPSRRRSGCLRGRGRSVRGHPPTLRPPPDLAATDNRTSRHRKGRFFGGYGGRHGYAHSRRRPALWGACEVGQASQITGSRAHPRAARARRSCYGWQGRHCRSRHARETQAPGAAVGARQAAPTVPFLHVLGGPWTLVTGRAAARSGDLLGASMCSLFFQQKCAFLPIRPHPQPWPRRSISRESPNSWER
jgi:hypothetical protein